MPENKKLILSIIVFFVFLFAFRGKALAVYDPLSVANNRFGIHIVNISDLEDAAKLVNSAGGDWGYVTLVITKNDRNTPKWWVAFLNSLQRAGCF